MTDDQLAVNEVVGNWITLPIEIQLNYFANRNANSVWQDFESLHNFDFATIVPSFQVNWYFICYAGPHIDV